MFILYMLAVIQVRHTGVSVSPKFFGVHLGLRVFSKITKITSFMLKLQGHMKRFKKYFKMNMTV